MSVFYKMIETVQLLHISVNRIIEISIILCMTLIMEHLWIKFIYFLLSLILYRKISPIIAFFFIIGYISGYHYMHCIYLWCINIGFSIVYSTYYIST